MITTVADFFQDESDEALRDQVKWQHEHLGLDDGFFAKLLSEDRRRFSFWVEDADTLAPDKVDVLRDWWQTVLHLLSFQSFDEEKLRSLLEQTRPIGSSNEASPFSPPWSASSLKAYLENGGPVAIAELNRWLESFRFGDPYAPPKRDPFRPNHHRRPTRQLVKAFPMGRHHIWNFHDPRLSVAQSAIRAIVSHSLTGAQGPGLMQARVAAWSSGLTSGQIVAMPRVGVCAGEPTIAALGSVLEQIDQKQITTADQACAAYLAARGVPQVAATQPAAGAVPAAAGAGTVTSGLGKDCMDLVAQYLLAWVLRDHNRENQIESEFNSSPCDPGWLVALKAWLVFYWNGQPPVYKPPTAATVPIPLPAPAEPGEPLRVGILGDWGTGEPEAIAVLDQLMQQKPDVIVHLGDIYYAGTIDECRTNFLLPIQAARQKYGRSIPVYTIPGNHDYYSGGAGFYGMIPLLNDGIANATVQEFSFFCLQNENWQLECMDTGYNDHSLNKVADDITHLEPAEADWHQQQMLAAGSRNIILMSHHQLFSSFATIGAGGRAFRIRS